MKQISAFAVELLIVGMLCGCGSNITASSPGQTAPTSSYYVNCAAASNGSGSQASPWNGLSSVNAHTFVPGDSVYFNRGATCLGSFTPQGSGSSGSPITVDAYGSGAVPILDGQTSDSVLHLNNQSYWTIQNLKLLHGVHYGLLLSASSPVTGIVLANIEATGASFVSTLGGDSGEIELVTPGNNTATISNVTLSGAYVHDSTVSRGIYVQAGNGQSSTGAKGNNITIANNQVSNVYGDGIVLADATGSLMQGNSVSQSGQCTNCTGPTPVGLWVWNSSGVTIQDNESWLNSSWGADGGGFDIDYWNTNITVQYNYAHDNKGYCISALGSASVATTGSIIRYNVCANNNNWAGSQPYGEIFLYTWNGGSLNGIQIYNNTLYYAPTGKTVPALTGTATFSGSSPDLFENNLIYSASGALMVQAASPLVLNDNLYFAPGGQPLTWQWGPNVYSSLAAWQGGSGQDAASLNVDPLLAAPGFHGTASPVSSYTLGSGSPAAHAGANVCNGISGCSMGSADFAGNANSVSGLISIGALQSSK